MFDEWPLKIESFRYWNKLTMMFNQHVYACTRIYSVYCIRTVYYSTLRLLLLPFHTLKCCMWCYCSHLCYFHVSTRSFKNSHTAQIVTYRLLRRHTRMTHIIWPLKRQIETKKCFVFHASKDNHSFFWVETYWRVNLSSFSVKSIKNSAMGSFSL